MKKELLMEFEEKFETIKKELKFKTNLEELDSIFFLKDYVLEKEYVSEKLSRMVCGRIMELYGSWINYLHGLVMPNPNYLPGVTESQMFEDKDEIMKMLEKIMALVSMNTLVGLTKDKKLESKFIDDSVQLWREINPELVKMLKKVHHTWVEKGK